MKEQGRRQPLWHRVEWLPGEPVFDSKLASWIAGSVNDVAANQSWTRPVRFSLGDRGEAIISSATGEEILRLSHEEFCNMLRDLKIDSDLETVLRSSIPPNP